VPPFRYPAAVRQFRKSNDFLVLDQTFDPTLDVRTRVESADGDLI
jgi:hypothetical protein